MSEDKNKPHVKVLNPEVARKIAAGEVIDRPNAIVRELMDNAVDSGADKITVEITGGGIEKIRVIDNGSGMSKEDLMTCARPHATSKISTEVDLMNRQGQKPVTLSEEGYTSEKPAIVDLAEQDSLTRFDKTKKNKHKNRNRNRHNRGYDDNHSPRQAGDSRKDQQA